MSKLLFVSFKEIMDTSNPGGVAYCTREFMALLSQGFDLKEFEISVRQDLWFRLKNKLQLSVYDQCLPGKSIQALVDCVRSEAISGVALNMTAAAVYAPVLKKHLGRNFPVILLSHGNESGDTLHDNCLKSPVAYSCMSMVRSWRLGRMLEKESLLRRDIDLVLTVSPVEEQIEKWLGAARVFYVPRTIEMNPLDWHPVTGRVGFTGDLSHAPNRRGLEDFCRQLMLKGGKGGGLEIRVTGKPDFIGRELEEKYPFVTYLGYLQEDDLQAEAATWVLFLNLVFYYSRGVSTKAAKFLGYGLPMISTLPGNRGYLWKGNPPPTAESVDEFVEMAIDHASDPGRAGRLRERLHQEILTMPTLPDIYNDLRERYPRMSLQWPIIK